MGKHFCSMLCHYTAGWLWMSPVPSFPLLQKGVSDMDFYTSVFWTHWQRALGSSSISKLFRVVQCYTATAGDGDGSMNQKQMKPKHPLTETNPQGLASHMVCLTYLPQEQWNIWYLVLNTSFENTKKVNNSSRQPGHTTMLLSYSPKEAVPFWVEQWG